MVRILIEGESGSARNMAVDEALLKLCGGVVLRFYRWSEEAVSIGYFQSWRVAPEGRIFVRRYTGGGLVDHARDLTYSIIAPREHELYREGVHASYRKIHEQIATALCDAGVDAMLAQSENQENEAACFKKAVKFDVVSKGRKLAGAAQRRTRTGCLHQGSILAENLDFDFYKVLSPRLLEILGMESRVDEMSAEEEKLAGELEREKYSTREWNFVR